MEPDTIICCSGCQQAISSGEGIARFKVPGKGSYLWFHRRFGAEDCWGNFFAQTEDGLLGTHRTSFGRRRQSEPSRN